MPRPSNVISMRDHSRWLHMQSIPGEKLARRSMLWREPVNRLLRRLHQATGIHALRKQTKLVGRVVTDRLSACL
jgi:hypothetical protein